MDGATTPDYVDDLLVQAPATTSWKPQILGYRISPFQHFAKPVGCRKYVGYNMARDPSWPKNMRPPLGKLKSFPSVWCDHLGVKGLSAEDHPMESILKITSSTEPQQVTYCTAPVYADWLSKQIRRPEVMSKPEAFWRGAGAIAHLAVDMCVWHHVFLCLLHGHQSYEGQIQEWGLRNRDRIMYWELPEVATHTEIRYEMETIAETTGGQSTPPATEWAIHHGFNATYTVIAWANSILPK